MKIGIISDTHDHMDNLKKAIELFNGRDIGHLIHAGDFVSPFTWRVMKLFKGEITAIFGNNDGERVLLNKLYKDQIHTQPYKFTIENKRIVVMHEPGVVESLSVSGHFDLVVYGHTHEPYVGQANGTLVVNPGEVCGWLSGKPTVAIVDLADMSAEIIPL